MAILERKTAGKNDLPTRMSRNNVGSHNRRDRRQTKERFFPWKLPLVLVLLAIFNLRRSPSSAGTFLSVDQELLKARGDVQGVKSAATVTDGTLSSTKDKVGAVTATKENKSPQNEKGAGKTATATTEDKSSSTAKDKPSEATATKKDTPSQKKEDQDVEKTAASANEEKLLPTAKDKVNGETMVEEKHTNGTSLASYSYGTTDVEEFKRLHHEYLLSRQEQLNSPHLSTKARDKDEDGNPITSFAYVRSSGFIAGFRNQMMALTMLAIRANHGGHKQLILDHLTLKDTYGTNKFEPFEMYFDVEHWNKYSYNEDRPKDSGFLPVNVSKPELFPNWLPQLVFYDPKIHDQLNPTTKMFASKEAATDPTRPYAFQKATTQLFLNYVVYGKGNGNFAPKPADKSLGKVRMRNPAEILLLQGALRPHPALQAVVDRNKERLRESGQRQKKSSSSTFRYMTLHARVEPDMQKHPVCRDKKVLRLQEIVDMMESKWPEPPVDSVFLPINRQYLEEEGTLPKNFKNDTNTSEAVNWIAVENLELLNRLTNHTGPGNEDGKSFRGLWNGTVPVVEFGSEALRGTVYEHRPSLSGAISNYFVALDADIFIGTEVSSYSSDILGSRFYRGLSAEVIDGESKNYTKNNYKYLPGGLEEWVTDDMVVPPNFLC